MNAVLHSSVLVSSLWRVFPISLSSQTDMPSLTTVALNKYVAFHYKKTVHTKSPSPSSPSFLDITPALQKYLFFPLSFTHASHHQIHIHVQINQISQQHHHNHIQTPPTPDIHLPRSSPTHHKQPSILATPQPRHTTHLSKPQSTPSPKNIPIFTLHQAQNRPHICHFPFEPLPSWKHPSTWKGTTQMSASIWR